MTHPKWLPVAFLFGLAVGLGLGWCLWGLLPDSPHQEPPIEAAVLPAIEADMDLIGEDLDRLQVLFDSLTEEQRENLRRYAEGARVVAQLGYSVEDVGR